MIVRLEYHGGAGIPRREAVTAGIGGADIDGTAGSTYTAVDADEGGTLRVRVAFTDDAGNEESLTSEPTAAVAEAETEPGRP